MNASGRFGTVAVLVGTVAAVAVVPEVRDVACQVACGTYADAESKVLHELPLTRRDLAGLSEIDLRRLRNAVYAHHGREFDSGDLRAYFASQPWYRPQGDFSEATLAPVDLENIIRIRQAEERAAAP
jgi:YARHG domain